MFCVVVRFLLKMGCFWCLLIGIRVGVRVGVVCVYCLG